MLMSTRCECQSQSIHLDLHWWSCRGISLFAVGIPSNQLDPLTPSKLWHCPQPEIYDFFFRISAFVFISTHFIKTLRMYKMSKIHYFLRVSGILFYLNPFHQNFENVQNPKCMIFFFQFFRLSLNLSPRLRTPAVSSGRSSTDTNTRASNDVRQRDE